MPKVFVADFDGTITKNSENKIDQFISNEAARICLDNFSQLKFLNQGIVQSTLNNIREPEAWRQIFFNVVSQEDHYFAIASMGDDDIQAPQASLFGKTRIEFYLLILLAFDSNQERAQINMNALVSGKSLYHAQDTTPQRWDKEIHLQVIANTISKKKNQPIDIKKDMILVDDSLLVYHQSHPFGIEVFLLIARKQNAVSEISQTVEQAITQKTDIREALIKLQNTSFSAVDPIHFAPERAFFIIGGSNSDLWEESVNQIIFSADRDLPTHLLSIPVHPTNLASFFKKMIEWKNQEQNTISKTNIEKIFDLIIKTHQQNTKEHKEPKLISQVMHTLLLKKECLLLEIYLQKIEDLPNLANIFCHLMKFVGNDDWDGFGNFSSSEIGKVLQKAVNENKGFQAKLNLSILQFWLENQVSNRNYDKSIFTFIVPCKLQLDDKFQQGILKFPIPRSLYSILIVNLEQFDLSNQQTIIEKIIKNNFAITEEEYHQLTKIFPKGKSELDFLYLKNLLKEELNDAEIKKLIDFLSSIDFNAVYEISKKAQFNLLHYFLSIGKKELFTCLQTTVPPFEYRELIREIDSCDLETIHILKENNLIKKFEATEENRQSLVTALSACSLTSQKGRYNPQEVQKNVERNMNVLKEILFPLSENKFFLKESIKKVQTTNLMYFISYQIFPFEEDCYHLITEMVKNHSDSIEYEIRINKAFIHQFFVQFGVQQILDEFLHITSMQIKGIILCAGLAVVPKPSINKENFPAIFEALMELTLDEDFTFFILESLDYYCSFFKDNIVEMCRNYFKLTQIDDIYELSRTLATHFKQIKFLFQYYPQYEEFFLQIIESYISMAIKRINSKDKNDFTTLFKEENLESLTNIFRLCSRDSLLSSSIVKNIQSVFNEIEFKDEKLQKKLKKRLKNLESALTTDNIHNQTNTSVYAFLNYLWKNDYLISLQIKVREFSANNNKKILPLILSTLIKFGNSNLVQFFLDLPTNKDIIVAPAALIEAIDLDHKVFFMLLEKASLKKEDSILLTILEKCYCEKEKQSEKIETLFKLYPDLKEHEKDLDEFYVTSRPNKQQKVANNSLTLFNSNNANDNNNNHPKMEITLPDQAL